MIKPDTLRAAIVAAVPDLRKNPDKFLVFIDEGKVSARNTESLSFEYQYQCNLILLDFAGDVSAVMLAVLTWAKTNQPDLLDNPKKRENGISFDADRLNNKTVDLAIKLDLSEDVKVTVDAQGKRTITHQAEPRPEWLYSGTLVAE